MVKVLEAGKEQHLVVAQEVAIVSVAVNELFQYWLFALESFWYVAL